MTAALRKKKPVPETAKHSRKIKKNGTPLPDETTTAVVDTAPKIPEPPPPAPPPPPDPDILKRFGNIRPSKLKDKAWRIQHGIGLEEP